MSAFTFAATPTFRDIRGRFAKANLDLLESRRDLMREQGQRYTQLAQQEAPGGEGHTVANQLGYRTFNNGQEVGFITTTGLIAKYHIYGTGIYGARGRPIVPIKAQALHFFINGTEFFRRSVRGVKPNAFLGRAYRRWLPGARADLRKVSTRYVGILERG